VLRIDHRNPPGSAVHVVPPDVRTALNITKNNFKKNIKNKNKKQT